MSYEIVLEHAGLIYSIIHSFKGYKSPEDLFQVGYIGLAKAYEKYDPSYEVKFSTFAFTYIWGEIYEEIRRDRGIKVSRGLCKINRQIERAYARLTQLNMKEPSIKEVADYLRLPMEAVENALISQNPLVSLEEPFMTAGRELTLHDMIPDNFTPDLDMIISLKNELSKLPPNDMDLINARFVMDMTQSETANSLGMTQVQVSRREEKVKKLLRSRLI